MQTMIYNCKQKQYPDLEINTNQRIDLMHLHNNESHCFYVVYEH